MTAVVARDHHGVILRHERPHLIRVAAADGVEQLLRGVHGVSDLLQDIALADRERPAPSGVAVAEAVGEIELAHVAAHRARRAQPHRHADVAAGARQLQSREPGAAILQIRSEAYADAAPERWGPPPPRRPGACR